MQDKAKNIADGNSMGEFVGSAIIFSFTVALCFLMLWTMS